jgi:DNA-binding beta-propeller fold protein YncE
VVNPRKFGLLLVVVASLVLGAACNTSPTKITNTPIAALNGQAGSFDAMEVDQTHQRLYVADRTDHGIDVFDVSTAQAQYLDTIKLPANPNGLAIAPDLGRLFVGTMAGSVVIVDINLAANATGVVIQEVPTGGKAVDLLDYAPSLHTVFASNGAEGTIASVDARTGVVNGLFKIGFALEQPRFSPADGMLYVTSPDAGALFQVDPASGKITDKAALGACLPKGLAINPQTDEAVIACHDSTVTRDLRAKTQGNFTQVYGGDVVSYDARVDRFFVAVPLAGGGEVGIFGGHPVDYLGTVSTKGAGNSAAYDETNDMVYALDTRAKTAGLTSFRRPADDAVPAGFVSSLGLLAGVLAVAAALIYAIARMGGPKPQPEAAPAPPATNPRSAASRLRHRRLG